MKIKVEGVEIENVTIGDTIKIISSLTTRKKPQDKKNEIIHKTKMPWSKDELEYLFNYAKGKKPINRIDRSGILSNHTLKAVETMASKLRTEYNLTPTQQEVVNENTPERLF